MFNQENCRKYTLLADVDETVVNIRPKMAELLILDKDIPNSDIKPELVKMYFDDPVSFMTHVLKSDTYKICDLMLTPAAKDKYRNRPHEIGLYIYNKYSENFYDDLSLSILGHKLKDALPVYDRHIFITHHADFISKESKARFIHGNFSTESEIIFWDPNLPKSQAINIIEREDNVNWSAYFDDRIHIVQDIITNCRITDRDIVLANFNYNIPKTPNCTTLDQLKLVAAAKGGRFSSFTIPEPELINITIQTPETTNN